MKILLTGVNPVQCGHRPRLDYISSVQALYKVLAESGNEVELRPVTPGEDLGSYDKVVVFLASMRGFMCRHAMGALWALTAVPDRVVISFDDWQVPGALAGIRAFVAEHEKIMAENPFGYANIEEARKLWPRMAPLAAVIADPAWTNNSYGWKVLVPAYRGGDLGKLQIPVPALSYNPSVLFKGKYGTAREDAYSSRTTAWTLAALHNHEPWVKKQKIHWPVEYFGHRKSKQPRVSEDQIYARYAANAGVLSPPYKTCGSGWWRARFGLAADALAIAAGSRGEMSMVGESYNLTPAEVEALPLSDLQELAEFQREQYYLSAGNLLSLRDEVMAAF